ncbi:hypothetical protein KME70_14605 [Ralstonia solanacearum]|nr:hypothetical protein KME70_14605 [Ralstonia solanacearum]
MFDDVNESYYWLDLRDDEKARTAKRKRYYRNQERGISFEERMFLEKKSYRLIFLTVGLDAEHREDVSLRTMQRFRDRFFRHIREAKSDNDLLNGVRGIVWRLEEGGRGGGLHLHLVVFYSAGRSGDVTICRELGEYWVNEITRGWGTYRNSNAHKYDFRNRWGLGWV